MPDRTFIDTNVLVYLYAGDAPEKAAVVADLLREGMGRNSLVISTQVMQEFYSVLTTKFQKAVSESSAADALRRLAVMEVVQVSPDLILAAAEISRRDKLNFWDALIIEAALEAGCTRLFTEDLQTGRSYGAMRILNPFPGYV